MGKQIFRINKFKKHLVLLHCHISTLREKKERKKQAKHEDLSQPIYRYLLRKRQIFLFSKSDLAELQDIKNGEQASNINFNVDFTEGK